MLGSPFGDAGHGELVPPFQRRQPGDGMSVAVPVERAVRAAREPMSIASTGTGLVGGTTRPSWSRFPASPPKSACQISIRLMPYRASATAVGDTVGESVWACFVMP
jgi:hypothetical protein